MINDSLLYDGSSSQGVRLYLQMSYMWDENELRSLWMEYNSCNNDNMTFKNYIKFLESQGIDILLKEAKNRGLLVPKIIVLK